MTIRREEWSGVSRRERRRQNFCDSSKNKTIRILAHRRCLVTVIRRGFGILSTLGWDILRTLKYRDPWPAAADSFLRQRQSIYIAFSRRVSRSRCLSSLLRLAVPPSEIKVSKSTCRLLFPCSDRAALRMSVFGTSRAQVRARTRTKPFCTFAFSTYERANLHRSPK